MLLDTAKAKSFKVWPGTLASPSYCSRPSPAGAVSLGSYVCAACAEWHPPPFPAETTTFNAYNPADWFLGLYTGDDPSCSSWTEGDINELLAAADASANESGEADLLSMCAESDERAPDPIVYLDAERCGAPDRFVDRIAGGLPFEPSAATFGSFGSTFSPGKILGLTPRGI